MKLTGLLGILLLSGCALFQRDPRTSVEAVLRRSQNMAVREINRVPDFLPPLVKMKILSPYGSRNGRPHTGLDLEAPYGTSIRAAAGGIVVYAGDGIDGYGLTVILRHDGDYSTLYAHLSELLPQAAAWVEAGEVIGRSGDTGNATGAHLHFEIRRGEHPLDPTPHLFPERALGSRK